MKKILLSIFFTIIVISSVFAVPYFIQTKGKVRKAAHAGSWYPENPAELKSLLSSYLEKSEDLGITGAIRALVSPHAGYQYSGLVAASAYKQLQGKKYETVVVISPCHIEYFHGCSLYDGSAYETPLGKLNIDKKINEALISKTDAVKYSDKGHKVSNNYRNEHSLELQLPFLQMVLGDFKLVPIVMGEQNLKVATNLGNALADILKDKNALIVASSDLSHFHPYDEAKAIDKKFVDCVSNYDYTGLSNGLKNGEIEACGGYPTVAAMIAAKKMGAKTVRVTKYANSGDVYRETKNRVVGYMGAVFYQNGESNNESASISEEDRKLLFEIAWNSINSGVKNENPKEISVTSDVLKEKRGAFVTIKKHGQLRGCIGYIIAVKPLYQTVNEVARLAALEDYRFTPVTEDELKDLKLEISVLSPMEQLDNPEDVVVGKHGLLIRRGSRQGVLLPQVPVEQKWDKHTYLQHICMKAGLPTDAWKKEGTQLFVFTAEVFSEE